MDTQHKEQPKHSQLLLEAISRAKENLHEQSRTPEQKALIKNKKNLEINSLTQKYITWTHKQRLEKLSLLQ